MVQQTVLHLLRQDYPRERFLVAVVDDSTDARLAARLAEFCGQVGAEYVRRPERRGYKAGALNYTTRLLPPDFELVAIIDADYWVDPDFLKRTVGYFADPSLSFVQTPQDYRNVGQSFLTRQYKRAEAYFYHAVMPSRNEQSAIIFCGTMGMLRVSALRQVGGFAEDQICEDAEVSVRLAAAGWDSLYVDRSFGKGLMPAVFDAYKKQFHRWAFGNVRIFFTRAWMILRSPMSARQKVDFLASNLHWFDGFFVTTIALVLLYLGLGPVFGYDAVTHHQRELALLAFVPLFLVVDGIVRLHLVLRQDGTTRLRDTLLVQGMWFAIKFTNVVAAAKCMLGFRSPFVRTSKDPGRRLGRFRAFFRALRITKVETLLGMALLLTAANNAALAVMYGISLGTVLLPLWLALYALFFLCAPIYAYLSYRTLGAEDEGAVPLAEATSRVRAKTVPMA
jgi:GT2 family glycosyltransferase